MRERGIGIYYVVENWIGSWAICINMCQYWDRGMLKQCIIINTYPLPLNNFTVIQYIEIHESCTMSAAIGASLRRQIVHPLIVDQFV
jgi:hypothetical protein